LVGLERIYHRTAAPYLDVVKNKLFVRRLEIELKLRDLVEAGRRHNPLDDALVAFNTRRADVSLPFKQKTNGGRLMAFDESRRVKVDGRLLDPGWNRLKRQCAVILERQCAVILERQCAVILEREVLLCCAGGRRLRRAA